ncbi:hypothetical protein D9619_003489 [Psilocybe cf. subviscida]|uniref:F-box domain-containing protein n=1 Tax=Psilocybe cf. subviscida TaxID=2480587 RepID=A0A8H5AX32_9AGAR|nr:hypothetical protein D9619_003489 [Psilocybe cf. subviscida]
MVFTDEEEYSDSDEDIITYRPPEGNACYINLLPDDVLVEIFKLVYESWPTKEHRQRTEIRVCQRWRELIINTPLLWTRIYLPNVFTGPSYDNAHSFERSRGALLDIIVRQIGEETDEEGEMIDRVLVEHQSRIRRLTFLSGSENSVAYVLAHWKSEDTPHLTAMHLNVSHYRFARRNLDYENFWAQQLEKLGIGFVRAWPGLSNLRTLILDDIDVRRFPASANLRVLQLGAIELTVKELQGIFERFPSLETLTIQQLSPLTGTRARLVVPDDTVLRAPSLRNLGIGSFRRHSTDCKCGLVYLAAPNLEYLELQCDPALLAQRHFAVLLNPDKAQNPRKIRLAMGYRTALVTDEVAEFLNNLPRKDEIDLEATWSVGPPGYHDRVNALLESTMGVRSLTIDFAFMREYGGMRPKRPHTNDFIQLLHEGKKCSPTYVRGLTDGADEMSYQEVDDALDGSGVELLRSPVPDWLVPKWNSFSVDTYDDHNQDEDNESD